MKNIIRLTTAFLLVVLFLTGCSNVTSLGEMPSGKTLVGINVTKAPDKTAYWMNETLDLAGIKVIAAFGDNSTELIGSGELTYSGFDSGKTGKQDITVTYDDKSDTFPVTVAAGTFTVTFHKNGGDNEANPHSKTVTQPAENVDSLPAPPIKEHHTFAGWNTKADGSGSAFDEASLVTGSLSVYAQWTTNIYSVTFNSNGGSAAPTQAVEHDEKAVEPAKPVIKNAYRCKFAGWYTDNTTFNHKWNFTDNPVTADIVLYAKWIPYVLGDTGPGGGKIFYLIEKGFSVTVDKISETCYYLEASPDNIDVAEWSSTQAIQNTEAAIGTGKQNTKFIADKLNRLDLKNWFAAQICDEYENNGFSDWFLPSKDELNQLYINRNYVNDILQDEYWSSTQYGIRDSAWFQSFYAEGNQAVGPLRTGKQVRAVRVF